MAVADMTGGFRKRLLDGNFLLGSMVTISSPALAEVYSYSGLDWLFIDTEHGDLAERDLANILRAVDDRLDCLVRVPSGDEVAIQRSLDLGATGIIVPQVNSAEQAAQVVSACRYPPDGRRGIGLARAHQYGAGFQDYLSHANQRMVVVVQAEHTLAVERIEEISSVRGIDCVLIGPYDLSASLGLTGQVDHPDVLMAIQKIESSCRVAGVALGIFGMNVDSVQPYIARGFELICVGIDTALLRQSALGIVRDARIGESGD